MGQSIVYEDAARQWEHLSLVLQPAEWSREDKTVVVALKLCPVIVSLAVTAFLSKPFVC
jgi:hypothetical protein